MSGRGMGSPVMFEARRPIVTLSGLGDVTLPESMYAPGTVRAGMDAVHDAVVGLMQDVQRDVAQIVSTAEGQRFFNDWQAFHAAWFAWYTRRIAAPDQGAIAHTLTGPFSALGAQDYAGGFLVADLRRLDAQYNELERHYRDLTGHEPTYQPRAASGQILPTEAWVGIGIGAGVLALGFVAWTASSVAKIKGPRLAGRRRR